MAWLRVLLTAFLAVPAKVLAPVAVLFVDRVRHPVWGNAWNYIDYNDSAFRNGARNFLARPMPEFTSVSNTDDLTLEKESGFQWRKRTSEDGRYVSFRCTWGKPRPSKGKREFYVGWKMRPNFEDNLMKFTFFQLRMF